MWRLSPRKACQFAGWGLLLGILALSLVPPSERPVTGLPHALEHFGIFFPTGVALAIGYPAKERLLLAALIAFSAAIELAQMLAHGRHGRWSDFGVDAVAACLGILIVLIVTKLTPSFRG
jgi:VanZ family protein